MRSALENARGKRTQPLSAHPGLLYERYVPLIYGDEPKDRSVKKTPEIGKIRSPETQEQLLREVSAIPISPAYRTAWRRWYAAIKPSGKSSDAVIRVVETTSRVLLGHGNPAPTEVGLTLHQVYGVPLLTGTSLKGVLNHYLASWGCAVDANWSGVGYDGAGHPRQAPGAYHGAIFGIPDLPAGDGEEQQGRRGGVVFEDAWLIPGEDDCPLCADVLTPHQGDYYREYGKKLPNDWTEPNPVTFLTIKPGTRFLLAISPLNAEREGADLVMAHLLDALEQWGVGTKTRAGYGRLHRVDGHMPDTTPASRERSRVPSKTEPLSETLDAVDKAVTAVLKPTNPDEAPPIAKRLEQHITDALLDSLLPEDHVQAAAVLKRLTKHAGLRKRRQARLDAIMSKVHR